MRYLDINDFSCRDGDTLLIDEAVDLSATEPAFSEVRVVGKLRNVVGVMTLRVTVFGTYVGTCDRCLEEAVIPLQSELKTVVTLSASEDESVYVENGRIDLELTAYDALVLEVPLQILCREDCRGLGPSCGKNLNDGDCECNN